MLFRDRTDAGSRLADEVAAGDLVDPIVLGLPWGGIPVRFEVARRIGAPLDVFVARKVDALGLDEASFAALVERERDEVRRRVRRYRAARPLPELRGRGVVLVDDGRLARESINPTRTMCRPSAVTGGGPCSPPCLPRPFFAGFAAVYVFQVLTDA